MTHLVLVCKIPDLLESPSRQLGELILRCASIGGGQVHVEAETVAYQRHAAAEQDEEQEGEGVEERVPCEDRYAQHVKFGSSVERSVARVEDPHVSHHEPYREEQLEERSRFVHQVRRTIKRQRQKKRRSYF